MTAQVGVSPDRRVVLGHAGMMMATFLIATSFPVGAAITNSMDSLVLTFLRFGLAALLFFPFVVCRHGFVLPKVADFLRYGLLSACLVAFFWGMFSALRSTTALNTATIFTVMPLITAFVARVLLGERLRVVARIALPVGMIGAVWVIFRGDWNAVVAMELGRGDGIFLAATVALALYSPLVKYLHRGEPIVLMTFWTLVMGALWLLLLSAPRIVDVEWAVVPLNVYGGIAYLAVFTTMVTFFTLQWCTNVIGPTKVTSYTFLNPVMVVLITMALGAPAVPSATYPGFVLIVTATLILQYDKRVR